MPTPAEKKAMLFLAAVGFLGVSVRAVRAISAVNRAPASSIRALDRQLEAVDSARAAERARNTRGSRRKSAATRKAREPAPKPNREAGRESGRDRGRGSRGTTEAPALAGSPVQSVISPPSPAGPLDLDVASLAQIESLPGIGPVLAKRVVADRDARGPFGSIANLRRVSGIGPALAKRLAPVVTFSGNPRPLSAAPPDSSARRRAARPRRRPGT